MHFAASARRWALDCLYGSKDVTRHWTRSPALRVAVDFDRHALCGVALREPLAKLSRMGRAHDPKRASLGLFEYPGDGLWFSEENGTVDCFVLCFHGSGGSPLKYESFRGECRFSGRRFRLTADTKESEALEVFGEPWWRIVEDGEPTLYYEHPGVEWQVIFTPAGRLSTVELSIHAELADPEARRQYGITREWAVG